MFTTCLPTRLLTFSTVRSNYQFIFLKIVLIFILHCHKLLTTRLLPNDTLYNRLIVWGGYVANVISTILHCFTSRFYVLHSYHLEPFSQIGSKALVPVGISIQPIRTLRWPFLLLLVQRIGSKALVLVGIFSQPIRTIRWLFPYWIQAGSKAAFLIFLDQSGFTWFLDPYLREGWAFRNQSCLSSCSMEHYLLWRILMPRLLYYSLIKKLLHANSSCLFISSPWVP